MIFPITFSFAVFFHYAPRKKISRKIHRMYEQNFRISFHESSR